MEFSVIWTRKSQGWCIALLGPVKEHSVVRLKNGRQAVVLVTHDYPDMPLSYLMELSETPEEMMVEVPHSDIEAVLWEPKD